MSQRLRRRGTGDRTTARCDRLMAAGRPVGDTGGGRTRDRVVPYAALVHRSSADELSEEGENPD